MPDKTPLELARKIVNAESPSGMGWSEVSKKVAAALIERMTPVEIKLLPGATRGVCQCGDTPDYDARFCEDCGVPIKWT